MINNIREQIKYNRATFEKVNSEYSNMKSIDDVIYTIMNYQLILSDMREFLTGYIEYVKSGNTQYSGKILANTKKYLDDMFTDTKKYRIDINLDEMKEINKQFLIESGKLSDVIDSCVDMEDIPNSKQLEMKELVRMIDNQYNKIIKVYKDDCKIYLYLRSNNSKIFNYNISDDLKIAFNNNSSPVIHTKKGFYK